MADKQEIELKVSRAMPEDAEKGIVRMDAKSMQAVGIVPGDIIEIEGGRATVAVAAKAYPSDVGLGVVRMDGLLRRNAKAGIGEPVKIRKADVKEAEKVTLAPAQKGVQVQIMGGGLEKSLMGRPVMKGDIISPIRARRKSAVDPFEDVFSAFEESFSPMFGFPGLKLMVVATKPKGACVITDMTEIELSPQAVEVKELEKIPQVTYEDIGGLSDAISKVREMIELPLKHPELFEKLGVEPPKGVLLYGPPGTGKTLLAKAVANETNANFIAINGPEIMCVSGDVPIIINNEIRKAEEIFGNQKITEIGSGSNHKSYSAKGKLIGVTNPTFSEVEADLLETTEVKVPYYYNVSFDGPNYDISSNHPLLTFSESGISWKTPPMLKENDYVVVNVIQKLNQPTIDYAKETKIKIPEKFGKELSFLVGLIAGDGHVGKDNITFAGKNRKLHDKFRQIITDVFKISKYKEYEDKEGNVRTVIYSTELVNFFNYLGFNSGKKEYKKFLENWLIKFDQKLYASFLLGLLVTDGTKGTHSAILYSVDKEALSKIAQIGNYRGFIFEKPKIHTNKLSNVSKIILKGKYNLELFNKILAELKLVDYKVPSSVRSFEYVPDFMIKVLKPIVKRTGTPYGQNYSIEPYLNLRKRPTIKTIETLLSLIKKREKLLTENDKAVISLLERFVDKEIILDKVNSISRINEQKILYDFGTTADTFITAYGHVMHNSKWYGESEKQLREVFEEAEKSAPSIIFIDEIDAIAPKREEVTGEVERRVVATLLSQMDGLKSRGRVVVIAATNRQDAIDPALRRGGRFDREIEIGVPDRKGRKEVLQIHTRAMPLEPDVDLDEWADVTYGFVGADLEALCKEAAMATLRRILPKINIEDEGEIPQKLLEELKVLKKDFKDAFKNVSPSAMREVLVEIPNIKWADIGGMDELKQQLKEAVEWPLKNAKMFKKMGIKPPKGILLYGAPGTGKTLLAKAVANESNANFISVKGPEIFSKWVGESERAIRKIFSKARQVAPCIVFFDELDAIAPIRGRDTGTHVTETVVNQMLTEMDGLEELEGVVVIGATNRPDIIDSGLLRPGRFDRMIYTPVPDKETRVKIFKVHTKNMPLAKDVTAEKLAADTEDYVGADIEAICREAAMIALRKSNLKAEEVSMPDFKAAIGVVRPTMNDDMKSYFEDVFKEFKRKAVAVPIERPKYLG